MKKRFSCALLGLALMIGLSGHALAAEDITAPVVVDGVEQTNFCATQYGDTTYTSFYGVTLALRPDAVITWENNQLVARADDFTMYARIGTNFLAINDRYLYIPDGVKVDDTGDTLVPTRVLATALGATISWENGNVTYTAAGTPLASGSTYYDAATVDLLARVITHESGNQPLEGKIAVGNVILNRVASPSFPNTVAEVLSQPNQFPGATDCVANSESILAAKLCLEGAMEAPGAYWFNGAGISCWASNNKSHIVTIGGHSFYG